MYCCRCCLVMKSCLTFANCKGLDMTEHPAQHKRSKPVLTQILQCSCKCSVSVVSSAAALAMLGHWNVRDAFTLKDPQEVIARKATKWTPDPSRMQLHGHWRVCGMTGVLGTFHLSRAVLSTLHRRAQVTFTRVLGNRNKNDPKFIGKIPSLMKAVFKGGCFKVCTYSKNMLLFLYFTSQDLNFHKLYLKKKSISVHISAQPASFT